MIFVVEPCVPAATQLEPIPPVSRKLLKQELAGGIFCRKTNFADREVYITNDKHSPHLMREIGRLREIAFRLAGGGTGKALDIDDFDLMKPGFQQLFVWDPKNEEIVGGYRFMHMAKAGSVKGRLRTPTGKLFDVSEGFWSEYAPCSIELGRSFVQPSYQTTKRGGVFALDNLWNGLGALIVDHPELKYFFGKVTLLPFLGTELRDLLVYFLHKHFPPKLELLRPHYPVTFSFPEAHLAAILSGADFTEDKRILMQEAKKHGKTVPPLVTAYMNLSPSMMAFGSSCNPAFGHVEELAILIDIADIYDSKIARHVDTYKAQ